MSQFLKDFFDIIIYNVNNLSALLIDMNISTILGTSLLFILVGFLIIQFFSRWFSSK